MLSEGHNRKAQSRMLHIDEADHFGILLATAMHDTPGAVTVRTFNKGNGLPARLAKQEWARFCKEYGKIEQLVASSFLSDELKEIYPDKYNFRRRRLSAILGD